MKKYSCMLILVSCGALFNVRKGYRAAERGTVKGLDMSAIRAKHKQQKGHSEVNGLMDILQRCPDFAAMFTVGTTKRKKKRKNFCFCQTDAVRRIQAHSHLSSSGSKERGNCFQNIQPRRKTDPDLSTGARISSCRMWPPAKRTERLEKKKPID